MPSAPLPLDEAARLAALQRYRILDTTPEHAFEHLVRVASRTFDVPIALVSLVDRARQWFKAEVGLGVAETPREVAFCAHAILDDAVMVVPDATADARFADNPLVSGEPHIRFYAGAPLVTPDGQALGTLCVIDRKNRTFSPVDQADLRHLAAEAMLQLELRRSLLELTAATASDAPAADLAGELEVLRRTIQELDDQRTEALEALERRGRHFRALVENSFDGIVLTDRGDLVDYVSPGAARVLGRPPAELRGRPLSTWLRCDDGDEPAASPVAPDAPVARTGTAQRPDGESRVVEVVSTDLRTHPDVGAIVHNFRDVTERKALEQAARHAQRLETVGRLASSIAHDFNNLLTAVMGHASLLLASIPEGSAARESVDEIVAAVARGAKLTRGLLAFGRRQPVHARVVDCNTAVDAVQRLLAGLLPGKIRLEVRLADEPLPVRIDPTQLEQVLMNLVLNARDAMPEGGTVTVRARRQGRSAVVAVVDTGGGIAPEVRERLFEPFFTTKPASQGTGLGLTIVQEIVAGAGGHVDVRSGDAGGAAFEVVLPLAGGAGDDAEEPPPQTRAGATGTVLVVDDDPVIRRFVERLLAQNGYRVLVADGGSSALSLAAECPGPIDVVLTDIAMPHMDGHELAARLRAVRPDTAIVYLTGHVDGVDPSLEHRVVHKPFDNAELLAAVARACHAA